jgi:SAM-dependent methyltransferase
MWSDPLLYELEFADDPAFDAAFWIGLCSRLGARRVLEPACGTGRLTLALARSGLAVTGYDSSEPFLARARSRLASEPEDVRARVSLSVGDMRAPEVGGAPFDLVAIAFSSLAYLHTREDQLACLRAAREACGEAGHFAFDVLAPHMHYLADAVQTCPTVRVDADHAALEHGWRRVLRTFSDRYDATTQTLRSTNTSTLQALDGRVEQRMGETVWHMYFPRELESLLDAAGLRVVERWGSYALAPWSGRSERYVWLCAPA